MRLANNGYFKHTQTFREAGGVSKDITVYTYVADNGLYDVCIWNGKHCYQKNSGGYSHDEIFPIHRAIEKHYCI